MSSNAIWIVRNGGEELELGRRGAWLIVWNNLNDRYIQFHTIDEQFEGEKICIESIETRVSHTASSGWEIKVVTQTGTIIEGHMVKL